MNTPVTPPSETELAFHAPGLARDLARLPAASQSLINDAFRAAIQFGALTEWPIARAPGVSFNPRPARLVHILLRDAKLSAPDLLAAAILSCARAPRVAAPLEHALHLAELAQSTDDGLGARPVVAVSADIAPLVAARALDEIRHLHMTELQHKERLHRLEYVTSSILPALTKHLPVLGRLHPLLDAACERFLRISEAS